MSQQVPRAADPAFTQKPAHLAAGDGFTAQFHLRIDFDLEPHLAAELSQRVHVARCFVAEMEVIAFMQFAGAQLFLQDLFRKLSRSHQGKVTSEGQEQHRIQAAGLEQAELFRGGRDQLEAGIRFQDANRMGFEGDRHRLGALLPCAAYDLLEYMTVGAVDTVEIPDTHDRRTEVGGNILEFVEDLHREQLLASSF